MRRHKRVNIDLEVAASFFKSHSVMEVTTNVPSDARIVDAFVDWETGTLELIFESSSFPDLAPFSQVPELSLSLTAWHPSDELLKLIR